MTRYAKDQTKRWVIQLWPSGIIIDETKKNVWLVSLTQQQLAKDSKWLAHIETEQNNGLLSMLDLPNPKWNSIVYHRAAEKLNNIKMVKMLLLY